VLLATRTQAEPLYRAKEMLRRLGWPDNRLRTLRRLISAIRAAR
jgi:hypothetical protein